jgi:GNAT superfamily N-acetyltransferase
MTTLTVQVEQLWVPDSLSDDDAADFLTVVDVARQVRIATWGNDDLAYSPEEFLESFDDPYERLVVLLARVDSRIVGRVGISMPLADNTDTAIISLEILPDCQGRGVGRELLEAAEQFARGELRRTLIVETHHSAAALEGDDGGVISAAHDSGTLPRSSREVVFASQAGYELQRVERFSSCPFPMGREDLDGLKSHASRTAGQDYAIHTWTDACPAEWVRDMAVLESLLDGDESVSAYEAGEPEIQWDDARVREAETLAQASGRQTMICAVEYQPTGRLVGFTAISILGHRDDVVFQDETVVLQEHRGRKLGMLIRVCNLERLAQEQRAIRKIYTWDAAEKEYMVSVNHALGFRPAGYTGEWQKRFDLE